MDEKLLKKLLHEQNEQDWFDFKVKLKLYQAGDSKPVDQPRDELIKDILGMANGNSHIIRKTKYLIIGADNKKFDENGMRVLYNVDYKTPSQSDLATWLSSACTPAVVGLECEEVFFQGIKLFAITIPPTFDLHETTRELNASGHFNKHTVFMRQDEHTFPASVRDGVTIQQLKHLYRQEVANPSSTWVGIIVGGIIAFIIGSAKIKSTQINLTIPDEILLLVLVLFGTYFGFVIGSSIKTWNETRYNWRYMNLKQRIILIISLIGLIIILFFIWKFMQ